MNPTKTINECWYAFDRQTSGLPIGLVDRALVAAREGERAHRRMGRGLSAYRVSVDTAARYFVLKWALDVPRHTGGLEGIASLRLDALLGHGIGAMLKRQGRHGDAFPRHLAAQLREIDYARDFVRP